ncbi:protein of unknown function [Taphrina deformans PYCC 5710]|uniref:PNPLA domain-containing protein n=1 Tax=Taphrina deformans (strain PYCC 5710 / ATCC 11124 / CBS 356.35 / IMI 108563 / JCM 9778 / NBRC 8474) TaxID=1097556 RepID=R4XET7_TAPDE|nr:protein of unknown function [Taphrina deformans PYCC 5710]|eukprot:CCG84138.1 protein of unknown function [Taphrina deformans PYCC 5710]
MLWDLLLGIISLVLDVLSHYRTKFRGRRSSVKHLKQSLRQAKDFAQYEDIALRLDYDIGNDVWRRNPQSRKYDHRVIADRLVQLRRARTKEDIPVLLDLLRSGLLRNLANISDKQLYNRSYLGTKVLIQDYVTEVMNCLEFIRVAPPNSSPFLSVEKKLQFFKDTRHSYGLSALVLQGGASFGMFHLGIARALWEQGLIPTVISGTAIGAIIAALICIFPDEELSPLLYEDTINLNAFDKRGSSGQTLRKIRRFFREGYILDISVLGELCRDNIGDITFEEAFMKTNRVLNITINSTSANSVPSTLNYLTAPNVLIWTAALASNALPGLYEPVELLCKDTAGTIIPWAPYGGVRFTRASDAETPFERLSELFNVNNFIISQARPYLAPLLSSPLHRHRRRGWYLKFLKVLGLEISHRLSQLCLVGAVPASAESYIKSVTTTQSEITLVPSLAFKDFLKLFRHPTYDEIHYWINKGERATWPAMSLLKVRGLVEITLRECYEALRHEEKLSSHGRKLTGTRLASSSRGREKAAPELSPTTPNLGARRSRKRSRTMDTTLAKLRPSSTDPRFFLRGSTSDGK